MKKLIFVMIAVICAACLVLCSCSAKGSALEDKAPANYDYESFTQQSSEKSDAPDSQKLIKKYALTAETKDYEGAVSYLDAAASECGGYYEQRREQTGKNYRYLSAVVRVPADRAEGFAEGMRGAATVTELYKTADNVTAAYVDAEARLKALEAEHESLLNMMKNLDSASEFDLWYKLQARISETEQEIASYQARLRNYDDLVSYSVVEINLREIKDVSSSSDAPFGDRMGDAFRESWSEFFNGLRDFAIGFVRAFPTLLTLTVISVVIFLAIFLPIRASKKRRRAAK